MKLIGLLVFISFKLTLAANKYETITVVEGTPNLTLKGIDVPESVKRITVNITWETEVNTPRQDVCKLNLTKYKCDGYDLIIFNLTKNDSKFYFGESITVLTLGAAKGSITHHYAVYNVKVIMPTTQFTTKLKVAYLLKPTEITTNEQTTENHTPATSTVLTSHAPITTTPIPTTILSENLPTPLKRFDAFMKLEITFLIAVGIIILAILLYCIFCRRIPNVPRRPVYRPIIGEPQQLQVEGGLRNLLFSFTVW